VGDAILTALAAAGAAALGTFVTSWYLESRKRLLEVRVRAYEDFLTAWALPDRTPDEIARKSALLLGAKARAALFGGAAVVNALKGYPAAGSAEHFATLLAAMRADLVVTVEEQSDGKSLLRAVFGPQDALRELPPPEPTSPDDEPKR
jgi:hypothetical protein